MLFGLLAVADAVELGDAELLLVLELFAVGGVAIVATISTRCPM